MTNYGYSAETKFLFYFLPLFYTRNCTDYLFKDKERPANDNEKKNFPIYSITLRGKASVVTCFCDILYSIHYTVQYFGHMKVDSILAIESVTIKCHLHSRAHILLYST